jgi:enterochelin esterase-like enzyme
MQNKIYINTLLMTLLLLASSLAFASAKGTLSDNIRINSNVLGYDLQYRVYTPNGVKANDKLPTLYMTDGESYAAKGRMVEALDKGIAAGEIKPVIAIFVDARDPDNLNVNRRNEQFFCNKAYVDFFTTELLPFIDNTYPTSPLRDERVILGLSFGGFNSGCFGLMATPYFGGIAMNSPANSKFVGFLKNEYKAASKKALKIFMSVGSVVDNRLAVRAFRSVLIKKGYELTYRQNRKDHNWKNWTPLLPDFLHTFFGLNKGD